MSTREAVIESLKGYTVTSFKRRKPTATDVDTLEKELAAIAAKVKTTLFEGGDRHDHLCCVLPDEAYGQIIDNADYEFEEPEAPEPYNPEINDNTPDHERKTLEADWERHKQDYQKYLGVQEVLRKLVVGAVSENYLRPLKQDYTEYETHTTRRLIDQIISKVKLTCHHPKSQHDGTDPLRLGSNRRPKFRISEFFRSGSGPKSTGTRFRPEIPTGFRSLSATFALPRVST